MFLCPERTGPPSLDHGTPYHCKVVLTRARTERSSHPHRPLLMCFVGTSTHRVSARTHHTSPAPLIGASFRPSQITDRSKHGPNAGTKSSLSLPGGIGLHKPLLSRTKTAPACCRTHTLHTLKAFTAWEHGQKVFWTFELFQSPVQTYLLYIMAAPLHLGPITTPDTVLQYAPVW